MCFYCPVNVFGEADNFRYILLFTIKTDTSVQGDTVNPCRYFTFFPEFRISFPEVQYYILIEVVERSVGMSIQIAYFVDYPLIFAYNRQELLLNRVVRSLMN